MFEHSYVRYEIKCWYGNKKTYLCPTTRMDYHRAACIIYHLTLSYKEKNDFNCD